jgi:hypothetical protein
MYQELTYDELKDVLNGWLNPDSETETEQSVSQETLSNNKSTDTSTEDAPFDINDDGLDNLDELSSNNTKKEKEVSTVSDIASQFDDLFDS